MSSNGSLGGGGFRKNEKADVLGAGRLGIAKSKDGRDGNGGRLVGGRRGGWISVIISSGTGSYLPGIASA